MRLFHRSHRDGSRPVVINILTTALICLGIMGVQPVNAAPPATHYYVDTTTDSNEPEYRVCDTNLTNNNCSLRGAISNAKLGDISTTQQVDIPTGIYSLTLPGLEEANASGDLDIYGRTIILKGAAMDTTIIDGNDLDRVIDHSGSFSLVINDLTITNGTVLTGNGGGGGIRTRSTASLLLENVSVTGNTVEGNNDADSGGGLYIENSEFTISVGHISSNYACHGGGMMIANTEEHNASFTLGNSGPNNQARCGRGGAVYVTGDANLTFDSWALSYNFAKEGGAYYDSSLTTMTMTLGGVNSNSIISGGTGAAGMEISGTASISTLNISANNASTGPGAISLKDGSVFTLTNATIANNDGEVAGGVLVTNNVSALLERVTISDNTSDTGGGISVITGGNIDLVNVTIAGNEASLNGGGINLDHNTSADLHHVTITTNNANVHGDAMYLTAGVWSTEESIYTHTGDGEACFYNGMGGSVYNHGSNIISDDTCPDDAYTDLPNTDPLLGNLGNYHSNLRTMPPLPGSPAIDIGLVGDPVTTDQRGHERFDGDRDGIVVSDAGAHESDDFLYLFLPLLIRP